MDFEYTDEDQAFRTEIRTWYRENLPDGWFEGDRSLPVDSEAERQEWRKEWQEKLAADRMTAMHWPEEYGGRGLDLKKQLIHRQEKARIQPPPEISTVGIDLVGPAILASGTDAQKDRFLDPILTGDELWCQGYSEPESGSDLASLQCRAYDEGDHWRINGQKIWTSNARQADFCYLLTRTDTSGPKYHGITALLVDMDQDAITVEPIRQPTDEATFNETFFDDAVAPKDRVLGEVNEGWSVAMNQLGHERVALSQSLQLEQTLKELVEFCETTTRDGRRLSEDPLVRQEIADLQTRVRAAKLTSYRNISIQIKEGGVGPEASFGKLFDNEVAKDLQRFAVNLLGPEGALWGDDASDGEWQSNMLGVFTRRIGGGTQDVQRNIIGDRVLGLPKSLHNMEVE